MTYQERKGQKLLNYLFPKVGPHEAIQGEAWQQYLVKCYNLKEYIWNMPDSEFDEIQMK